MTDPYEKLAELGVELPKVVPPVASYQPAVRTGDYVYVSGQLPMIDGKMPKTGLVGSEVSPEEAKQMAKTCALNGLAAVESLIGLDKVARIVKIAGFVASAPGLTAQPGVVNGASDILGEIFGEAGKHARSAVGVAVLPLDAPVEVEMIVEVSS